MSDTVDAIRDSARDFLARQDQRARKRALARADNAGAIDRAYWQEIAGLGWMMILAPEAEGGLGLGWTEVAAVADEAGRALLPEPWLAAGVLPISVLLGLEAGATRDALLERAMSGEIVAGLAWQETEGQLESSESAGTFSTSYVRQGEGYVLNGEKLFVMPGSDEDGWLVTADGAAGAHLFWIPAESAGVTRHTSRRADASSTARLVFQDVAVGAAGLLASGGLVWQQVDAALDLTRIAQAAELIGVARETLAITVDYVNTRQQFGKPIGSFQALQHRLVDALLQIELAQASLTEALGVIDGAAGLAAGRRLALASRVKARATRAALETTRLSIQMHGAIGYTAEYDVGLYFKRAFHLSAWLGNQAAHQRRYAGLEQKEERAETAPQTDADFPRHADWGAMSDTEFRQMVRGFFQAHYPEELRHMPWRLHWDEIKEWYFTLARQGWIAPSWPRRFGGMELPPSKLVAFIEESERYGVARAPDQGLIMLGPILARFGTPEQQARFMPRILSGEDVWAQGYSEPNAGSDLASLRCEAVLEDGHFVVTGQKTWSTLAQDATHMFVLVRTDKTVKKQAGISFLLVDLASPGVTVRPIETLCGDAEFAEVFFDAVRVPAENLVGGLNEGWTIAKALLGFERLFSGSPKHSNYALSQVRALARMKGVLDEPVFRDRLAALELDVEDLSAMYGVFAEMVKAGKALPSEVSLLKVWASETHERIGALLIQLAEEAGGADARLPYGDSKVYVQSPYLTALAATIFSGANEIQRNILAKQVLGLAQ